MWPRTRCSAAPSSRSRAIGGYHLACRADDEAVVARLRARKHREDRPFALMVVRPRCRRAADRLTRARRPIVLVPRRDGGRAVGRAALARARRDAPLLAAAPPAARRRRRATRDDERQRLRRADRVRGRRRARAARGHRRRVPAARPADPHAHRRLGRARRADLRRSRGYVPATLPVADAPPLLACGAELKNTFTLARDGRAWVGHHIGDLRNYETLRSFTDGDRALPAAVRGRAGARRPRPAPGVPVDEVRARPRPACRRRPAPPRPPRRVPGRARRAGRLPARSTTAPATAPTAPSGAARSCAATCTASNGSAHLWPVRMPGGEAAIREPWRMACAWLVAAGLDVPPEWEQVAQLARTGLRLAGDDEHGPPVRRGRRAVRRPPDRHVRGPGGRRARGRRRPPRARRAIRWRRARRTRDDRRGRCGT